MSGASVTFAFPGRLPLIGKGARAAISMTIVAANVVRDEQGAENLRKIARRFKQGAFLAS